jgi:hypothetical protein
MDRESPFGQVCFCGRQFTQRSALTNHQKTCKKTKTRLSKALAKAKEYAASKKLGKAITAANVAQDGPDVLHELVEVRHTTFICFPC